MNGAEILENPMRRLFSLCLICSVAVGYCAAPLGAGDFDTDRLDNWHQWRGPEATGTARHAKPPLEWDTEKNVQWKVELPGAGESTPIVWGNRVFLLTAIKTDREEEAPPEEVAEAPGGNPFKIDRPTHYYQFVVLCYDRNSGELLWEKMVNELVPHEGAHRDHGFASASPVTDGEHLWVSFGSRGIFCLDMDGNEVWQRDLGDMSIMRFFGEGISPVLHDDTLIVNWDHEGDSYLYALDAATGETRWEVPRDTHTSWATPVVVEHEGRTQVVVSANETSKVRSYDLKTGEQIWECGGLTLACIPSPITYQGLVYCMSGYMKSAMLAIPLSSTGDVTDSDSIVWSRDSDAPYCPSACLYDGRLYFNKSNGSVFTCLDAASGEAIIEKVRLPGIRALYASPVAADGRIYFTSRDGTTVVLDDGPELKVLATNELDEATDASAAIVGNQFFLRTDDHLYCFSEEK